MKSTRLTSRINLANASTCRKAPIIVRKSGKPVAVMMSMAEFEHFQRLEDLYWVARAEAAEVSGEWVSHEQAVKLLTERLKQGQ